MNPDFAEILSALSDAAELLALAQELVATRTPFLRCLGGMGSTRVGVGLGRAELG